MKRYKLQRIGRTDKSGGGTRLDSKPAIGILMSGPPEVGKQVVMLANPIERPDGSMPDGRYVQTSTVKEVFPKVTDPLQADDWVFTTESGSVYSLTEATDQ